MADEKNDRLNKDALRRYGPLVGLVLIAQVIILWVFIETLSSRFSDQADVSSIAESRRLPHYYAPEALRRITVNPARTKGQRFLSVSAELGLKAYDRTRVPPKDDVTRGLVKDGATLAILDKYASKMRSIIREALSRRGVDEFDRQDLIPLQNEIRERINREVLRPAFAGDKAKRDIVVVEVLFTELVLQ